MGTILTPYDDDTAYEPHPWVRGGVASPGGLPRRATTEDYGKVDFDDSSALTVLTLAARPGGQPHEPGVTVLDVEIPEDSQVKLVLNGRTVWLGTPEWEHPAFALIRRYVDDTESGNEPDADPYVYDVGGELEHLLGGSPWESIDPAGGEARVLADYFKQYVVWQLGEGRIA